MIHIVIGGALAGKTTYVRKTYLQPSFTIARYEGVTVSVNDKAIVIGNYSKRKRTVGVDQLGRNIERVHERVLDVLFAWGHRERIVVAEGTTLHNYGFIGGLKGMPVRLIYVRAPGHVITKRAKELNIKWPSLVRMTHRSAALVWNKYKGEFPHEIIE